jgi:CzcA family heavy metal efflux pump
MFRWLIGLSLEFRFVVLGIAAALVVFGTFQVQKMPVDVFPEFEAPTVKVQTEALGLSAQEMENLVTLNLEELLSGVPWLESMRSESVTGLSSIVMKFKRGTDLIRARQMVQERLALAIYLPNVAAAPSLLQPVSSTNRFMMVGVSSDKIEPTELSMILRWSVQPKLVGLSGVSNVSIWGQRLRQMQVQIDPRRLRDARVIQDDIVAASGDALWVSPLTFLKGSTPGTGGWIDNKNQRLGVLHTMPIYTPEDMAKVPVAPQHLLLKGKKMGLGDVTEVTFDHPPMIGDAFVNGRNGFMLVLEKFPSANTLEVTAAVDQALREIQRGLPGVNIDANVFRLADYVDDSIDNLTEALIIGAILVVFVVGAALFNWRTALISLVSIPLSLLAAVIVLSWTSATLNVMVLAGLVLALGVVIDDAIVGVERFVERLRARKDGGQSVADVIVRTTLETRGASVYAALIIVLALLPIFFMGGVSGALFGPLATSYALAVVASLVVGLTVTPALSLILFRGAAGATGESPAAVALRNGYQTMLRRIMNAPRATGGIAAAAVVVCLAMWPLLGQSLLPTLKEKELVVRVAAAPGTSHQETYRVTSRLGQELKSVRGVRNVGAHVGRAILGDQVVGVNSAQLWVGIDPYADHDQVVAKIRETVDGYPGLDRSVQSYLRNTIGEALTGETNAVVVRIYGQERDVLNRKAEEVRQALAGVRGLVDLRSIGPVEEPQIKVKVDLAKAGSANVNPGEVRRSSATVFAGLNVGFLYEAQKIFDVVVWGTPESRRSLDNLRDVLVEKSDRHHVRLGDVANVTIEPTPTSLRRADISPYVDVVANVVGRDLASVNRDVEARLDRISFPLEVYPQVLGEFAERESAQQSVLAIAIAAVIGIFLLLQACFRSWRLAIIGFLALPAAVAGGVLAGLASGGVLTLGSLVGFLAVIGLAARHAILLINHYQHLERSEGVPFGCDLVLRGARERVAPILTSSAAIIAALLPIVVFGRIAGLEIAQPTSIVIIGGVVASTLVTLLVIPTLYLLFGSRDSQHDLALA